MIVKVVKEGTWGGKESEWERQTERKEKLGWVVYL